MPSTATTFPRTLGDVMEYLELTGNVPEEDDLHCKSRNYNDSFNRMHIMIDKSSL